MTALSTLRLYSEQKQIPFHHFTRFISAGIFAVYAYKYACPFAADCVRNVTEQVSSLQQSVSACGKANDQKHQQDLIEQLFAKRAVKCLQNETGTGNASKSEASDDYTDLGVSKEGLVGRLVQILCQMLRWLQRITGIRLSFPLQMLQLLRIMIPTVWGPEALLVAMHTLTLIARTFLSIYVDKLEGSVVKFIVRRDPVNFGAQLTRWLLIALPCSFTNSLIRFLECQLALAFRSRLVAHAYQLYFSNRTYYAASNLDTRLENADHSLTDDLSCFATHCAHLYSSVTKPLLDLSLISYTLYNMASEMGASGRQGPLLGALAIISTHAILRFVSPSFGRLVSEEARRRGFLRFVHSRIIGHAEEIGFYGGEHIEQSLVQTAYDGLSQQMNRIYNQRLWYIMLEQFLMKYVWSATGMVMVAIPVMAGSVVLPNQSHDSREDVSERTQYMTTAKNILIAGGDAAERLMSSYKELIELTGYTRRVAKMFTVFEQVGRGKFIRNGASQLKLEKSPALRIGPDGAPILRGRIKEVSDFIRLVDVPVITPNLDTVIESINLKIERGMHLLITGPNGCGKSSLFRLLSSLWPIHKGSLERPPPNQLFYIPQRPYMSLGTLRDQLIYPHTINEMARKGVTDDDLEEILDLVHLKSIVRREGGWDARGDWREMLSGGEKQRMALGRLFYHKPMFALLDECTSAVSMDVECKLYQSAKSMGITLITITHRPSLWKYHTHLLQFDGEGGYQIEPLDSDTRLSLRDEKEKLQAQLAGVPEMTTRLKELCTILGEDSILIEADK